MNFAGCFTVNWGNITSIQTEIEKNNEKKKKM